MGVPQPTISRRIAGLEQLLGLTLLTRTTRRVETTEAGRRVVDHARQMLVHAEAAKGAVAEMQTDPSGLLRVTAPVVLGQAFISTVISDFLETHPGIDLSVEWTARAVDPIVDPVDIAIRVGRPGDSAATLVRLGSGRNAVFAPPNWGGPPVLHPRDLERHTFAGLGRRAGPGALRFTQGRQVCEVPVRWRLHANDIHPITETTKKTGGLAVLPRFSQPQGWTELVPDWLMNEVEINALTAGTRGSLPRVRLFLESLKKHLTAKIGKSK
jgi:DNA-binding transcriptional LysR family regulator